MTYHAVHTRSFAKRAVLPLLVALGTLSACDSKPEGQVVAIVDGDEVTAQELNGELAGYGNVQEESQAIRNQALDKVVRRRLLADIARSEGIESSPDYILRRKKLEEGLLLQMLTEQVARDIGNPSDAGINKVIRENPQAFAERALFDVDQISFQPANVNAVVQALRSTTTMDEVVTVLNRMGIDYERSDTTIDSASLPQTVFAQFRTVGSREPLIIPSAQATSVVKIQATRPSPRSGAQARPIAANAFLQQEARKRLQERLEEAERNAEVQYQEGYGKPAAASEGANGASATAAPSAGPNGQATPRNGPAQ